MYTVMNIPATNDKTRDLAHEATDKGAHVYTTRPAARWNDPPERMSSCCQLEISEWHLEHPEDLKRMVAHAMEQCIRAGQKAGYLQAQYDMRKALGLDPRNF